MYDDQSRRRAIQSFLMLCDNWNRPSYVTYHAIEIFDKFVAACDEPKEARVSGKLSTIVCFLLSCKMDGLYPAYKEISDVCNVCQTTLTEYERFILSELDWKIKPCYTFMDMHRKLPEHLLPSYDKMMLRSYELNQLDIYPSEIIELAMLSILYDDDCSCDRPTCQLALQVCKDTLCPTPNSPVSVCDKHVTSNKKQKVM